MPRDAKRKASASASESGSEFEPSQEASSSSSEGADAPSSPSSPASPPARKKAKKPSATPDAADPAPGSAKKRAATKPKDPEFGVDLTEHDQAPDLTRKYDAMKTDALKLVLKANRAITSGAKAALVARCVDGELWGAFPPCPRCVTGKLKVKYPAPSGHRGQGEWSCRGAFDAEIGAFVPCYFKAGEGEVARERWRDVDDPAPEPARPGGADEEPEPPSGLPAPEVFGALGPKEAADALLEAATRLGFQLPDASVVRSEIGAQLMAKRDPETGAWDGDASLAALREMYPPLSKKEREGGEPAKVPENSALASCLDKLVRLEKRAKGDAFKIKSYVAAAAAIRALDYAATSGKAMAKPGKTKVAGIGKGIAAKIDEFLETGTMERIVELEASGGVER